MWHHGNTVDPYWMDLETQDCPVSTPGQEDVVGSWWKASVRWDGCVHLYKAGNVPFVGEEGSPHRKKEGACDSYMHVCCVNDLIELLTELQEKAQEHFGPAWK